MQLAPTATRRCRFDSCIRCTATHCNTLQHTATYCNILRHTATYLLQHTAAHCNAAISTLVTNIYAFFIAYWGKKNAAQMSIF